jgi:hypothetical protein
MPTTGDTKIVATSEGDTFEIALEGLASGTTYYVRAYATNGVGTAYGEVKNFMTDNQSPTAINVSISGTAEVNKPLIASYTYQDAEEDEESGSTYQWYKANDGSGAGITAIDGATSMTYTPAEADKGKYIAFGVTPKAATGTTPGIEVKSTFLGGIGEATTVTFTYNNQTVTYGILNGKTGRKWLDRNLGAPAVPTKVDDYANYGDLFQWGRLADGHQLIVRSGPNDENMSGNETTTELSTKDNPGHNKVILCLPPPNDWITPQKASLWQGVNGINNPCPSGWRVPTSEEWATEAIANVGDGYTKLKLTFTGYRNGGDGSFLGNTFGGYYQSSTVANLDPIRSIRIRFNTAIDGTGYDEFAANRAAAYAVRCIKHQ